MDPLIYSVKFKVKGHDVNSSMYMTIPALLKIMQEASLQHARLLKTSVWDMTEDKLTWVLIRKELKVITPLKLDGIYTILTYPSGFDKFFAHRDYLVFDSDKKIVAGVSSTWTLLKTDTRKIIKIPQKILDIGIPKETRFLPKPSKTIALPNEMEISDVRKVRSYDLDWNNHVNNIVLIRFVMEAIKNIEVEDHQISKLLVQFKNELNLNQSVNVMLGQNENDIFSILKEVESNKEIVLCKVSLKPETTSNK